MLATVHKAKGLEWDTVMIAEDFHEPQDLAQPGMAQEVNATYVAVTRAVRVLQPSRGLSAFYAGASQALALSIKECGPNSKCSCCGGLVQTESHQGLPGSMLVKSVNTPT